ncbi:hypothetical protein [Desulfovibrio sp. ZJ200]|uniref:hypothetical protein n=1 Tax=Desulfovibrio sp. ZJ200 TaxID=2709792 RepID=UPI0013EB0769|nr:hypothetical protein [Desulfovibrio sp. ZJ200]
MRSLLPGTRCLAESFATLSAQGDQLAENQCSATMQACGGRHCGIGKKIHLPEYILNTTSLFLR